MKNSKIFHRPSSAGQPEARGGGGRQERSSGPNNPVQPDTRLAGGMMGGHAGGRCAISRTPPPLPPCRNLPPFPKKNTGTPLTLVLLSSNPPPLNTPPPPRSQHPPLILRKCKHLFWGFLGSKLNMFRSTENQMSSGRVTVKCGRSVDQSKWWGFGVSGPEGWHVASSISKVMTTVLTLASPWKPSADRHNSNYQFSILSWG